LPWLTRTAGPTIGCAAYGIRSVTFDEEAVAMHRLARQFRRPVVFLSVIYLAGVGLLAAVLPYQPAMIVPRGDFHQMVIGFSPDGLRFAIGPRVSHISVVGRGNTLDLPDDPFQVWNTAVSPPTRCKLPTDVEDQVLLAFALNPTGRRFFWSYIDNPQWRAGESSPNPWGIDARDPQWRSNLPTLNTAACQFSPDGRFALRYNDDRTAKVVEWATGRVVFPVTEPTVSVAFLPDGLTAVGANLSYVGADKHAHYSISRWRLTDGRAFDFKEWDDASAAVNGGLSPEMLQLTPDGRWLVDLWEPSARNPPGNGLVIWDLADGRKHFAVPSARWFAFASGGHALVTVHGSTDPRVPRVRLLDLDTGATLALFPGKSEGGGDEYLPTVIPGPHGDSLAVGVPDSRPHPLADWPRLAKWLKRAGIDLEPNESFVSLIRTVDGRELASIPFGPTTIWFDAPECSVSEPTMAFSADGRRLAVLSEDAIRIWDLPIRCSWRLILSLAAVPPAALALLVLAVRGLRRLRTPRPALPGAV
jgi:WD40 repeat protein